MLTLTDIESGLKEWDWQLQHLQEPIPHIRANYVFPYENYEIIVSLLIRMKKDFLLVTSVNLIKNIKETERYLAFLQANDTTLGCKFYMPLSHGDDPSKETGIIDCAFEVPVEHLTREMAMDMIDNLLAEIEYHVPGMIKAKLLDISEVLHKDKEVKES